MKKKFSYSTSDELTRPRKFVVKSIERLSGRKKVEKVYESYEKENKDT